MTATKKQKSTPKKDYEGFSVILEEENKKFVNDEATTKKRKKTTTINDCVDFARENEALYREHIIKKFERSLNTINS